MRELLAYGLGGRTCPVNQKGGGGTE